MAEYKSPNETEIIMSVLMHPDDMNPAGNIFGGKILALMDQAAYVCACKHAQASTVTASVNTVNFLTPVHVGDCVTIKARVNHAGNSSMVIGLRVEAENIIEGHVRHCNTSYFTMVAMENGKPKQVPGLILQTPDDVRRFVRSYERRENQKARMKRFQTRSFVLNEEEVQWCNTQNARVDEALLHSLDVHEED